MTSAALRRVLAPASSHAHPLRSQPRVQEGETARGAGLGRGGALPGRRCDPRAVTAPRLFLSILGRREKRQLWSPHRIATYFPPQGISLALGGAGRGSVRVAGESQLEVTAGHYGQRHLPLAPQSPSPEPQLPNRKRIRRLRGGDRGVPASIGDVPVPTPTRSLNAASLYLYLPRR